jgi:hypothetical protein
MRHSRVPDNNIKRRTEIDGMPAVRSGLPGLPEGGERGAGGGVGAEPPVPRAKNSRRPGRGASDRPPATACHRLPTRAKGRTYAWTRRPLLAPLPGLMVFWVWLSQGLRCRFTPGYALRSLRLVRGPNRNTFPPAPQTKYPAAFPPGLFCPESGTPFGGFSPSTPVDPPPISAPTVDVLSVLSGSRL